MSANKLFIPLLASVGINLFLAGIVAVPLLHRPRHSRESFSTNDELSKRPHERHGVRPGPRGGDAPPGMRGEGADGAEQRLLHELIALLGGPADPRVKPILEQSRSARRDQKATLMAARREAGLALTRVPFSEEDLAQKLTAITEAERSRKQAAHQAVIALGRLLTDQQRAQLQSRFPGPTLPTP
jgi:hypothetical protein